MAGAVEDAPSSLESSLEHDLASVVDDAEISDLVDPVLPPEDTEREDLLPHLAAQQTLLDLDVKQLISLVQVITFQVHFFLFKMYRILLEAGLSLVSFGSINVRGFE